MTNTRWHIPVAERIAVPWRGMDVASAPDYLPAGVGRLVRNLVPGRSGQLVPRGPVNQWADIGYSMSNLLDDPAFGCGGFWTRPPGTDYSMLVSKSTGIVRRTVGGGAMSADMVIPGNAGGLSSSYALESDFTVGPLTGNNPLLCWYTNDSLTTITNGPYQVTAVCDHQSRIFALGGRPPGGGAGGAYQNNALYWTDPVPAGVSNLLSMWQDDASGLVNKIVLPATDTYRDVVTLNRVLYVIGDRTVLALYGDTPSTYVLRKVLDIGAWKQPPGGACATDRGLYFVADCGLVRFDGTQSEVVSEAIRPYFPTNGKWSQITALPNGYLSVIVQNHWLLYHEASGAWAELTCGQFGPSLVHNGNLPTAVRRSADALVSGWFVVSPGSSGNPGRVCLTQYLAQPDNYYGGTFATTAILDGGATGPQATAIDAQAVSGDIRLTGPERRARLDRLLAQGVGGWQVDLTREDGSALPFGVTLAAQSYRVRAETSEHAEADIVRAKWTWQTPGFNLLPAAMDAYVTTMWAQQR